MRSLIPVLSVILALIAAGSIAYIAWDLTSDKPPGGRDKEKGEDPADGQEPDR
jgi:hypothetical protein